MKYGSLCHLNVCISLLILDMAIANCWGIDHLHLRILLRIQAIYKTPNNENSKRQFVKTTSKKLMCFVATKNRWDDI
jgi:hypothetical protein